MQITFEIENDVSVLKDKSYNYDFYLDSYLEMLVQDDNNEISLFSTTIHSTIMITFTEILIELYKTGKKQILDTFGNANVYTLQRVANNMKITNSSTLSGQIEWIHLFDLIEFMNAYTKEMKRYLNAMVKVESEITDHQNYILLRERLNKLEAEIQPK